MYIRIYVPITCNDFNDIRSKFLLFGCTNVTVPCVYTGGVYIYIYILFVYTGVAICIKF